MQVVLQGRLEHFPLSQVLLFLGRNGHSGTLDVGTTACRTRLYFERGTIVAAEGEGEQSDAQAIVAGAFEGSSGEFVFLDGAEIPSSLNRVSLDVDVVVAEAARRAAAGYSDEAVLRVVDDAAAQDKITLTPDQLKLLIRIGEGKAFGALVADLGGNREEVGARVKALAQAGLIVQGAPPAAPPAQRKRRRSRHTFIGSLTADEGEVQPLLDAEHTIGRDPSNSICISDASVSSRHARITKSGNGFVLEDLNSRNGTFLNGEKLSGKQLLSNGDTIRFGKVIFTFQVASDPDLQEDTQGAARGT